MGNPGLIYRELKEETGLGLVKVNHISLPVFSSAGLTDESCHMVLVEAKGEASDIWSDEHCRHGSCKNYCDRLHYGNVFEAMRNSRIPVYIMYGQRKVLFPWLTPLIPHQIFEKP